MFFRSKQFNIRETVKLVAEDADLSELLQEESAGYSEEFQALHQNMKDQHENLRYVRTRTQKSMAEPNPRTMVHHIVQLIRSVSYLTALFDQISVSNR